MSQPNNRFILKFNSDIGRIVRLSIPRARMDKNATDTTTAMERLLRDDVISMANRGIPASINSAKVVSTERRTVV